MKNHAALTRKERLQLMLKARLREDADDYQRLLASCPRMTYVGPDAKFLDLLDATEHVAWDFFHTWTTALDGRRNGIGEVLHATNRVFAATEVEAIWEGLALTRRCTARFCESQSKADDAVRSDDQADSSIENDASQSVDVLSAPYRNALASIQEEALGGYAQFVSYLRSLSEGLSRYALSEHLTVDEALAALPLPVRSSLLAQIARLPDIPFNEELAASYVARYSRPAQSDLEVDVQICDNGL